MAQQHLDSSTSMPEPQPQAPALDDYVVTAVITAFNNPELTVGKLEELDLGITLCALVGVVRTMFIEKVSQSRKLPPGMQPWDNEGRMCAPFGSLKEAADKKVKDSIVGHDITLILGYWLRYVSKYKARISSDNTD